MPTIEELEARLKVCEDILGVQHLGTWVTDIPTLLKPENELPNGQYPYILSAWQLHNAFNELKKDWPAGMSIVEYVRQQQNQPIDKQGGQLPAPPQE